MGDTIFTAPAKASLDLKVKKPHALHIVFDFERMSYDRWEVVQVEDKSLEPKEYQD